RCQIRRIRFARKPMVRTRAGPVHEESPAGVEGRTTLRTPAGASLVKYATRRGGWCSDAPGGDGESAVRSCAHTTTMARNRVMDASAAASSTTARNMTFTPDATNVGRTMFPFCSKVKRKKMRTSCSGGRPAPALLTLGGGLELDDLPVLDGH